MVPIRLPSIAQEEVGGPALAPPSEPTLPPSTWPERPSIEEKKVESPPRVTPPLPPTPPRVGPSPRERTAIPSQPRPTLPIGISPAERRLGKVEAIRFAGANHLCIILGYNGTKRLVEPYSLRRTKDGNILLHTVRVDSGESRTYRTDKIESVELTQKAFKPRYAIELTATGPIYIPPQSSNRAGTEMRASRVRSSHSGPRYIFRCPVCDKKFTRQKYESSLNEHKNKDGYKCYGRYGVFEETKWD